MIASLHTDGGARRLPLLRGLIPIAVSLLVLWVLRDSIGAVNVSAITSATGMYSLTDWCIAAVLTAISFAAVAQYDRLVAAWMGLALPRKLFLHAGWRATAISQVLGYGLVTGSLTRWRALGRPGQLSLWQCSHLTLGVTVCFFAGWAVVTCFAVLIVPAGTFPAWATALSLGILVLTCALLTASASPSTFWARHVPGPVFLLPVIGFAALDTAAAAAVLYVFLQTPDVTFVLVYAAFLVALCAGMISGLPGGLGAFELTFISILAPTDPAPVLSAILAFRLIYYGAPAILAGASLIWVSSKSQRSDPCALIPLRQLSPALKCAAPPEFDLTSQGPLAALTQPDETAAVLWFRSDNCDLTLGDPFGTRPSCQILAQLQAKARTAGRTLALYKCGTKTANTARQLGMYAFQIGSEAVLDVRGFNTQGSQFRQLRRKLRNATKANFKVTEERPRYSELAAIDAAWQRRSGTARGFSMGQLSPQLLARQRVFVAMKGGRPIAFISMLVGPNKWTLDLIRTNATCPDGTVHALVMAAIEAARTEDVATLSLAAAPFRLSHPARSLPERVVQFVFGKSRECQGLAQFKASFAPDWHPQYLAVKSLFGLPYAVLDIWTLIHRNTSAPNMFRSHAHNDYGNYEFESCPRPCHALQRMTVKDSSDDPQRSHFYPR